MAPHPEPVAVAHPMAFLDRGGEIASLMQAVDWNTSPLGDPADWSPSLKTVMTMLLSVQAQIVLFWGSHYVALYNQAYSPTIGAKHPHALGRPAIEYWAELWDDLEPLLRGVRETGETFSAKDRPFYIERAGFGEQVFFDISYSAVREPDGSVGGVLCIVTETTERVQFERRQAFLLELGQALRETAEAAQMEALVVQRLAAHLEAERVIYAAGHDDARAFDVQRPARPMFAPHEIQLVEETARLTRLAISHARAEATVRARSAELAALNEQLEERVVAMVAEREEAIAQLHEARKMRVVGQLTGGIAHDFNNLLTPIMASLELIRRRLPEERMVTLIDGALQSADRARVLVGRLLAFARRQTLRPQAIDLAELLANLRELIEHSLGPTVEVRLEIPAGLPPILVDPHQLELALLNLAVNARDAMADGGRLGFSASLDTVAPGLQAGRYLRLNVVDDGCGMSAEVLAHCVEPFFTTKGVGKGTGLGLSMVQGLAMQSGGSFDVASRPGEGTVISLWLPVAEKWAQEIEEDKAELAPAPRHTQVLLVDDEDLVRQTTALLLRDLGYEVIACASPSAALGKVEEGLVPDILVTDYIMAERSGAQLANGLRQRFPDLPVLIVTGYTDLNAQQLSAFAVLAKPYRRAELAESIVRLLPR